MYNEKLHSMITAYMADKKSVNEKEFFGELSEATLYVPSSQKMDEAGNIAIELIMDGKGDKYFPAYLDKASAMEAFSDCYLVDISFEMIRAMFMEVTDDICGIVIGPFKINFVINRNLINVIDACTMGDDVDDEYYDEHIVLTDPGKIPDGLKKGLKECLNNHLEVNAAWIFLAKVPNERDFRWMFMIDFFGSEEELFPRLEGKIEDLLRTGEAFKFMKKPEELDELEIEDLLVYRREGAVRS